MTAAETFDVAVVGGGFAGIAAAVCAAECGARTLLVEQNDVLGGNASSAFVHTVCGLYRAAEAGDALTLNPGFAAHFANALRSGGAAGAPERAGKVWVLPTEPQRIPDVAARVCSAPAGLVVRANTTLVGLALGKGDAAHRLVLEGSAGRSEVDARVVIDTSGDAGAAALGNAAVEQTPPGLLQLPSYIFRIEGVEAGALEGFARMRVTHAVAAGVRAGALPRGCESVLVRPGGDAGSAYVTLTLPRVDDAAYTPLDAAQREQLKLRARGFAEQVAEYLRTRPEFAASRVAAWPRRIGVREARRMVGRACISEADVLGGHRQPDVVAQSSWPIELWHEHRGARFAYPEGDCDIPFGALVSASHPRVGAAGRCLSASHEALGALRVLGTALATGEAIGVAAALAADRGVGLPEIAAEAIRAHIQARAHERTPA